MTSHLCRAPALCGPPYQRQEVHTPRARYLSVNLDSQSFPLTLPEGVTDDMFENDLAGEEVLTLDIPDYHSQRGKLATRTVPDSLHRLKRTSQTCNIILSQSHYATRPPLLIITGPMTTDLDPDGDGLDQIQSRID